MLDFSVNYKGVDYEVTGYLTKYRPATWGYYGGSPEEPSEFIIESIEPEPDFDIDLDEKFMVLLEERATEEAADQDEAAHDYYWEDR